MDGVGTIIAIISLSIHADRTNAKSLNYGDFRMAELLNVDTHVMNVHRLPNKSALERIF